MRSALIGLLALVGTGTAPYAALGAAVPAWTVDKAHSKIGFQSSFGEMNFSGAFARWDATINFDPNALAQSKVSVKIDTASARTGDSDRDTNLPTSDWFAVKKFPQATFVTTSIKSTGGDKYVANGLLTIKGASKPVALPFTLKSEGNTATVTGSLLIDRSQWGIGQGQFSGEEPIPHVVTLQISIVASKS